MVINVPLSPKTGTGAGDSQSHPQVCACKDSTHSIALYHVVELVVCQGIDAGSGSPR